MMMNKKKSKTNSEREGNQETILKENINSEIEE